MSYRFSDSLRAGSGWNWFRPDPARKLSENLYDIYHCCVYSEKLLMMNEELSETCRDLFENRFEKLVPLVGFTIRINVLTHGRNLEGVGGGARESNSSSSNIFST